MTANFYASNTYLEKYGVPQSFDDMVEHDFIGFGDNDRLIELLTPSGLKLTHKNFPLSSANGIVAWEMAKEGLGIIIMSDEVGGSSPLMQRLLPKMKPFEFPIWLTVHRELHTSRRIRIVFDLLADFLTKNKDG